MANKGQTIEDRLTAALYTIAGKALARCVCKATTMEPIRPKIKHLDYLAACTYEADVSMQQLANMLIERANHPTSTIVVYKALITVHHLMSYGSERFTQYLASSNYSFQLDGVVLWPMTNFIKSYANYINQKALSYRTMAVDLCRTQRGEDNILRTMPIERLLETLPIIQKQLETLLDFSCESSDLENSIVRASFTLLFHDAIRLFASYNDGIINLFEKYFDLNKKMCREAFDAYKRFLDCTDRVAKFLKIGEAINLDHGELPDFKRAPSSLLDALEQHLSSLENNKKRGDKVVIDTKLAAFPSFTASSSLDFSPPPLATMAIEFDSKLSFASDDNEFDKAVAHPKVETLDDIVLPPPESTPPVVAKASTPEPKPQPALSSANSELQSLQIDTVDPFDSKPPGYSGGSLLTPELSLQSRIDPSIDPQTQLQLIQIQREQAKSKHGHSNDGAFSSMINSNQRPGSDRNSNFTKEKSKKESMFEDLEKTMRQSLQKVEKA